MKGNLKQYLLPLERRHVEVSHILKNGEILTTLRAFEPHEIKFNWVNKTEIIDLILLLRTKTKTNKKTVVAIYEGGEIKVFENEATDFIPPII